MRELHSSGATYQTGVKFLLKLNNAAQRNAVLDNPKPLFQIIDLLQEKNIEFMKFMLEGEDGVVLEISYENTVFSLFFGQKGITKYTRESTALENYETDCFGFL